MGDLTWKTIVFLCVYVTLGALFTSLAVALGVTPEWVAAHPDLYWSAILGLAVMALAFVFIAGARPPESPAPSVDVDD